VVHGAEAHRLFSICTDTTMAERIAIMLVDEVRNIDFRITEECWVDGTSFRLWAYERLRLAVVWSSHGVARGDADAMEARSVSNGHNPLASFLTWCLWRVQNSKAYKSSSSLHTTYGALHGRR
jgi:hypothetical protein